MATMEGRCDDDGGAARGRPDLGGGDGSAVADTQLMQLVARFVFGTGGQAADRLGDALGINRRSVQRWLNGQNAVPTNGDFWRGLAELVAARLRDLELIRDAVERRAAEKRG